jgi:tetratricopeptide (TPR) repeat protein
VSAARAQALARAEGLGHLRRLDACESACRALLAEAPGELAALRLLAWALLERGALAEALAVARDGVRVAPEDLHARRLLLRALLRAGGGDESVAHARVCALHPEGTGEDHARWARALAASPDENGAHARSREAIDRALAIPAAGRRAPYEALRAAMLLGDHPRIARCAGALLAAGPDDPHDRAWVARAALAVGDAREALRHADAALASGPNTALAWKVRALALARLGRDAEAREAVAAWGHADR